MIAQITIGNTNHNVVDIMRLVGIAPTVSPPIDQPDIHWMRDGVLFVNDVTQQALDDAYAEYKTTFVAPNLLDVYKDNAKRSIDATAGQARSKYITTAPGQAEVYIMKADEANRFIAAGYPGTVDDYPFITAEAVATGKTVQVAADDIVAAKTAWIALGATIEQIRLTAKKNVGSAASEAAVDLIVNDTHLALMEI